MPQGAHPEVAMLHEEFGAVLFRSNWVRRRFRDPLHNLDIRYVELEAPGGAFVSPNLAFDYDARFLGEGLDGVEDFGSDGILGNDSLNHSGAIAKLGEEQFATLPQVVQPASDSNGLAIMFTDINDRGDRRHKNL